MFGPSLHPVVCRRTYVLLCTQCFQFVSIVHSRFFLRFSLTFIEVYNRYGTHSLCLFVLFDCVYITPLSTIFLLYSGEQFHWWRKPRTRTKSSTCRKSLAIGLIEWVLKKTTKATHTLIPYIFPYYFDSTFIVFFLIIQIWWLVYCLCHIYYIPMELACIVGFDWLIFYLKSSIYNSLLICTTGRSAIFKTWNTACHIYNNTQKYL